jgi:hypothetical protein
MPKHLHKFHDADGDHFIDPQLAAMARRLDVDLGHTENLSQLEALSLACTKCGSKVHCTNCLQSTGVRGYHEFCPNASILDKMGIEAWRRGDHLRVDGLLDACQTGIVQRSDGSPEG